MDLNLDWCAPEECSLPLADQPSRVAEWDSLFATAVRQVEAVPGRARFELDRRVATAASVADLTDRESQCCAFLTFGLTIGSGTLALDVTAGPEHADVVKALASRAAALSVRTAG